jgi:hypothetical protein
MIFDIAVIFQNLKERERERNSSRIHTPTHASIKLVLEFDLFLHVKKKKK